jgi:hypothetical protein
MRLKNPQLKDTLPTQLCLLCDRAFCVDHKGKEDGVCEINHETYYRNHPAARKHLYRTYEDWQKDNEQMMIDEASDNEGKVVVVVRKESDPSGRTPHVGLPKTHKFDSTIYFCFFCRYQKAF